MKKVFSEGIVARIIALNPNIKELVIVTTSQESYGVAHSAIIKGIFGKEGKRSLEIKRKIQNFSQTWNMPFSRASLYLMQNEAIPLNKPTAELLTHHNKMRIERRIDSSEWSAVVDKGALNDKRRSVMALSSRVKLHNGKYAHIPMIDFGCMNDKVGFDSAVSALQVLEIPEFLLNSGKSFHFYGKRLLTREAFFAFLGKASLLSPLIDGPWVAHQLIEGAAALRLSVKQGYSRRPYLVAEV